MSQRFFESLMEVLIRRKYKTIHIGKLVLWVDQTLGAEAAKRASDFLWEAARKSGLKILDKVEN